MVCGGGRGRRCRHGLATAASSRRTRHGHLVVVPVVLPEVVVVGLCRPAVADVGARRSAARRRVHGVRGTHVRHARAGAIVGPRRGRKWGRIRAGLDNRGDYGTVLVNIRPSAHAVEGGVALDLITPLVRHAHVLREAFATAALARDAADAEGFHGVLHGRRLDNGRVDVVVVYANLYVSTVPEFLRVGALCVASLVVPLEDAALTYNIRHAQLNSVSVDGIWVRFWH